MDGKTICKKLVGSDDERAVSPVIGVILMVAITVILAAVITTFVTDIGPGSSGDAPSAQFDAEVSDELSDGVDSDDNITEFTMVGGDQFDASNLEAAGDVSNIEVIGNTGQMTAGDTVTIQFSGTIEDINEGDEVSIVWNSGGSSTTVSTFTFSDTYTT